MNYKILPSISLTVQDTIEQTRGAIANARKNRIPTC